MQLLARSTTLREKGECCKLQQQSAARTVSAAKDLQTEHNNAFLGDLSAQSRVTCFDLSLLYKEGTVGTFFAQDLESTVLIPTVSVLLWQMRHMETIPAAATLSMPHPIERLQFSSDRTSMHSGCSLFCTTVAPMHTMGECVSASFSD